MAKYVEVIAITLPTYAWEAITLERTSYRPPMPLGLWFRLFTRAHHTDPIAWPNGAWLGTHGEGGVPGFTSDMPKGRIVNTGGHAWLLLKARTLAEPGDPGMATVLRRLVCQYLGYAPGEGETVPSYVKRVAPPKPRKLGR